MLKRFLLFIPLILSCSHSLANTIFTYEVTNGWFELTGCVETCPFDLVIPEEIDGYSVTSISGGAFAYRQLASVTIPDTVTSIGYRAFANNELTSVMIPDSVASLFGGTFANNQLTRVTISDSVIANTAFIDNPGISSGEFRYLLSSENAIIIGCTNTCVSDLVIPESIDGYAVTTIGAQAFSYNELTGVTIPDSVTSIWEWAFSHNQLTSLTISNTLTTINNSVFHDNQLISVTIPDSVTSIGNYAFSDNRLINVTIPDSLNSIGWGAFANNELTSVTIPDSVFSIGTRAFSNNQLISVTISDSVIANTAFIDNPGISSGEFRYLLSSENAIIIGCTNTCVSDLVIPESIDGYAVTEIGDMAFYLPPLTNYQLTNVTIPDSVIRIGGSAFEGNALASITIPNSVTSIGHSAFANNQLVSLTIPDSVTTIEDGVFSSNNLTSVIISDGVTSIGERAFTNNLLTSVTFPASVTSIGNLSFRFSNINHLHFDGKLPEISNSAFTFNPLQTITYCQNSNGDWDNVVIEGITPEHDENCVLDDDSVNWDFDQSESFDALTDGLLLLRYSFGLRSDSLTSGAISAESTLSQAEVESNIEQVLTIADIDNNGSVDALTDGLLLLRYAFGLRGENLISGAVSTQGLRNTATDIEAYIESHMP